jgi:hypothetical protein
MVSETFANNKFVAFFQPSESSRPLSQPAAGHTGTVPIGVGSLPQSTPDRHWLDASLGLVSRKSLQDSQLAQIHNSIQERPRGMQRSFLWLAAGGLWFSLVGEAAGAATIYVESGGVVAFEAEGFSGKIDDPSHNWTIQTVGFSNATGGSYMQLLPDDSTQRTSSAADVSTAPFLLYDILISQAGTYQLFARFEAFPGGIAGRSGDSFYAQIAGQAD